jgi:hypothetical protein
VDGSGSGSCPMEGFRISGAVPSSSNIRVLVKGAKIKLPT